MLPQKPRQERYYPLVGQEHVVGIAELPLGLERSVIGFELGEFEDLRDRDIFGFDFFGGVVFGETRFGPVVDDEAEIGELGMEGVGERDFVCVNAVLGWDFLEGKDEVDEFVVVVYELGFLGLRFGIPPFEECVYGLLDHLVTHSRSWFRHCLGGREGDEGFLREEASSGFWD